MRSTVAEVDLTVRNEWGLIISVLNKYAPSLNVSVNLPGYISKVNELSTPEDIFRIIRRTEIELPVLLSMWLSFTMSELQGLTKSSSIKGDYLYIDKVTVVTKKREVSFHDLRHVNASVMSFLNVPDKYAMERGGWSTDKVMKGTYMQVYNAERIKVDDNIDNYFETALFNKHSLDEKYLAYLTLFGKEDCKISQQEYIDFVKCNTKQKNP